MSSSDTTDVGALTGVANRVVVVTGAGQGLGRTFAKALSQAGAIPVIAERNAERGRAVAEEIRQAGGRALAVETDVADPTSVDAMAKKTVLELGRIDVLINNAGIFSTLAMRPFEDIPLEEWDAVLRVNVTGAMLCCRAVLPQMRQAGWGRIINMSSGSILLGRPNYLHYTTSKAALIGMIRSMARELGKDGITVNAILPGAVETEIPRQTVTPEQRARITALQCVPRAQVPSDLVGIVLFLASDGSGFMTGQSLNLDGGATHL